MTRAKARYTCVMGALLSRAIWLVLGVSAISYAFYVIIADTLHIDAAQELVIVDAIGVAEHRLSGEIMVPSQCHAFAVTIEEIAYARFNLRFDTWQEAHRDCPREPYPRKFHAVVFAPSLGTEFTAKLDGDPLAVRVVRQLPL